MQSIICCHSRLERSFQTKQLLFTRGFLSVRVALASAAGPHASCRAAQHGACRWLVSHGIRAPSGHSHCVQVAAATPWTLHCLSNRSNECPTVARICLSMSSCSECDGPDRVLPGLIQLPARDGAYKSRCSVLDVMEASTRLINAVPPDVVLAACRALRMAAAAITYLLRSVDVGAQAPTPALGKMASWPSCAMRCAKIQVESTGPCSRCCCLVSQNH